MPFDPPTPGPGPQSFCAACKRPILGAPWTIIHCPEIPEVEGEYHDGCAKPLQSLLRAHAALSRNPFS